MGHESLTCCVQVSFLDRLEPVEDEQDVLSGPVKTRAHALTPVPATAGHTEVVAPDDLALVGGDDDLLAVGDRVERLVPDRPHEARKPT